MTLSAKEGPSPVRKAPGSAPSERRPESASRAVAAVTAFALACAVSAPAFGEPPPPTRTPVLSATSTLGTTPIVAGAPLVLGTPTVARTPIVATTPTVATPPIVATPPGIGRVASFPAALALSAPPLSGAPTVRALAPSFTDEEILEEPSYFQLRSFAARYTHFDQWGKGYQSRAGSMRGPGSQDLSVEQPQIEAVIEQGSDIVHRIWVPVDVVTAASPDAVDAVSTASQTNEAGAVDWSVTYGERTTAPITAHGGFHGEENYRSYNFGLSGVLSLAEDNTVLQANAMQLLDWFDKYRFGGAHNGHAPRSATYASAGLTQILSPYTIAYLDYGITYQQGQLSNTWNIVPYLDKRLIEVLPPSRTRHALVGRIAEWLPWNGALKASYRFYADDWDIVAHSAEFELDQRLHPYLYIGAIYRIHTQSQARFYVEHLADEPKFRTADSDLAAFTAHTVGGKASLEMPFETAFARRLHVDVEVDRYVRTNNLEVMVYTCEIGFSR